MKFRAFLATNKKGEFGLNMINSKTETNFILILKDIKKKAKLKNIEFKDIIDKQVIGNKGSFNGVFEVYIDDDKTKTYALRISLFPIKKDINIVNEIKLMDYASTNGIGPKLLFPKLSEYNLDSIDTFSVEYITGEEKDKYKDKVIVFSISDFYETESVNAFLQTKDVSKEMTENKKKVIDNVIKVFDLSISKEVSLFCVDIKFSNFVYKKDTLEVKMIDFDRCNRDIYNYMKKTTYEKDVEIFRNMLLIQLFKSCPVELHQYFINKLNIDSLLETYNTIILDVYGYKDVLHNIFWYYRDDANFIIDFEPFKEYILLGEKNGEMLLPVIKDYIKKNKVLTVYYINSLLSNKVARPYIVPIIQNSVYLLFAIILSYFSGEENEKKKIEKHQMVLVKIQQSALSKVFYKIFYKSKEESVESNKIELEDIVFEEPKNKKQRIEDGKKRSKKKKSKKKRSKKSKKRSKRKV